MMGESSMIDDRQVSTDKFTVWNADTVEVAQSLPVESVDFSVFSPPFSSLFAYTAIDRDFSNCKSYAQFFEQYAFLVKEQFRVLKSGRLVAMHVMQLPLSKQHDGEIGLRDFRGDMIRAYQKEGFIYHSEVCISKDPVVAMTRTKALGLLYKQLRKDSAMSRQGIADYLVIMRKPGVNVEPVTKTHESFPVERWQRYAAPVWVTTQGVDDEGFGRCVSVYANDESGDGGIDQGNTLNVRTAKEEDDSKHLCALQIGVIRRAIKLWTNPNDVVWSPFMGIGSEGYVALQEGRRFLGAELKKSYFDQAVRNLREASSDRQPSLFAGLTDPA